MMRKTITIVAACYNEAGNIKKMHDRIKNTFASLPYDYDLLYVDNASTDNSREIYQQMINEDSHVRVIFIARNTGTSQASYFAGLQHSLGDATVLIDGDLQDQPELIAEFIKKWEEGYPVVYGVRVRRKGSLLRRFFYRCFYHVFRWLSYLDIPLNAGDFGLLDKKVVKIIAQLTEKDLYLRGLRAWVGFKQVGVEYIRDDRYSGVSSISFFRNFYWAKKAIVNFSYKPLEFISRLAIGAIFVTFLLAIVYLYIYFTTEIPRGFMTLLMVCFTFGSLQLLALSVMAEYMIRVFQEVKNRPPYIIDEIWQKEREQ